MPACTLLLWLCFTKHEATRNTLLKRRVRDAYHVAGRSRKQRSWSDRLHDEASEKRASQQQLAAQSALQLKLAEEESVLSEREASARGRSLRKLARHPNLDLTQHSPCGPTS